MIDPISITIITLACSVAAALKSVYDMICKFFKSISNWRLSRMFKEIGSLMQQYKRDGWLPASRKYFQEARKRGLEKDVYRTEC
ncbi:hypothetical protein H9L39_16826 [Fusarium oxysporum f. sp. albedinis]|nr:hypothetical protein H9L39_16826 [Fusarium oxysporum f. sp. albedinis]